MRTVLLTHCGQYAGPGALAALLGEGWRVACHDTRFAIASERAAFLAEQVQARALALAESGAASGPESRPAHGQTAGPQQGAHGRVLALEAQTPEAIAAEVVAHWGLPDAVVCNDVHPNRPAPIEDTPLCAFDEAYHALVRFPIALSQALLPGMKQRRAGAFVFITSAREQSPETGFAVATSLRAATTAFARALAREAAPFGVQANAVQPNYLASELYYPRARFVDDPAGRAEIARVVPAGRLGNPAELGALIAFLASGRSPFTTGQVFSFTGGWP